MYQRKVCQHCEAFFNGRRNQTYCTANCRKRYSEAVQNPLNSREKKNSNMRLIHSESRIAELYFTGSPFERLGIMRGYIALAKQVNGKMREILFNKFLLSQGLTAKTITFSSYSPSDVGLYKVKYQNA